MPPHDDEDQPPRSTFSYKKCVVVVRHGERLDYMMRDTGENWIPSSNRPWDPPLTQRGHEQANALGNVLPKILKDLGLPPIAAVYSSPFLRCRQTAVGLLSFLGDTKVRVELGLAESINENWFRSWAVPGTDGSWGFMKNEKPLASLDVSTLHPAVSQPIATILDWKAEPGDGASIASRMDKDYVSRSSIGGDYCMNPANFESFKMQRKRMHETMEMLSDGHRDETIVLVSHGGPVTHLYESLTGNKWDLHGVSKYCSYSIYYQSGEETNWKPRAVNQVLGQEANATVEYSTTENKSFTWA